MRREPPVVLRCELADARDRGEDFDSAWSGALGIALRAAEDGERAAWSAALTSTQAAWRGAYEMEPGGSLARALGALNDPERCEAIGRACARCGTDLPPNAHGIQRYCSESCGRAARKESERRGVLAGVVA